MNEKRYKELMEIVFDIYRESYLNSTPTANFDELYENAEIVDGVKQVPFMDYEINDDVLVEIIDKHLAKHKLDDSEKNNIRLEVLLGMSPKSKIVEYHGYGQRS